MHVSYSDMRRFDDKLDLILIGVSAIAANTAERDALRAEIAALIEAEAMDQAAKDALNAKIAAVLARSEVVESKLRAAIPGNNP